MTEIVEFSLFGHVNPIESGESFLIPVFGDKENLWAQEIDHNGIITGFTSCYLPESANVIFESEVKRRRVGEHALYAFYFDDKTIIADTKNRLQQVLEKWIDEFSDPFIKLEVLIFIGKEEAFPETINDIIKKLNSISPQYAKEWKKWTDFQLLPWDRLTKYLYRVKELVTNWPEEIASSVKPLPDLGYYFTYRWPKLTLALKKLTELPLDDVSLLIERIFRLIEILWYMDIGQFPSKIRKTLVTLILNPLVRSLEKLSNDIQLNPEQIIYVNSAIIRTHMLFSKLRELGNVLDLRYRISNLSQALLRADKAGFFDGKAQFLSEIITEITDTSSLIPETPDKLLQETSFHNETEKIKIDGLINAADIFRFHSLVIFVFNNQHKEALQYINKSERFYSRAKDYVNNVPNKRARVFQRYARTLIFKGEILAQLGNKSFANESFNLAVNELKNLTISDYPEKDIINGPYSNLILQTEALISRTKNFNEEYEELSLYQQIESNLKKLINDKPEDVKARLLLFEYYIDVKRDVSSAVDELDSLIIELRRRSAEPDENTTRSIDWLQYLTARICALASTENSSYISSAVSRYAMVLRDQPKNTIATYELMDLLCKLTKNQFDDATILLSEKLKTVDMDNCPLTHAIVRLLFSEKPPNINRVESPAQALIALIGGDVDTDNIANLLIRFGGAKYFRSILELLSRWYFEQGRLNHFRGKLMIANKILDLSLKILDSLAEKKEDKEKYAKDRVIWMTRKLDIALLQKDFDMARQVVTQLEQGFPEDPIVKLKSAILLILEGDLIKADSVLREADIVDVESDGIIEPHPAILDRRAYIALRQNQFDISESLYRKILSDNQLDPTARFGLGRIFFEQGHEHWVNALDEWIKVLRLRVRQDTPRDIFLAWLTARSIASLCKQQPKYAQLSESQLRNQILNRLQEILNSEDAKVSSMIVDSLGALGIVDAKVAKVVLYTLQSSNNIFLNRRIAQYLMSRTIYATLDVENDSLINSEIISYVDKCNNAGVLPEYISGAKGSYGRALLKLRLQGKNLNDILSLQMTDFKESLNGNLKDFYNHVCSLGYSESYYPKTYSKFKQLGKQDDYQWSLFVKNLISDISFKIWEHRLPMTKLLSNMSPMISLWSLKDILHLQNGRTAVGGWVDLDALSVFEQTFGQNGWRVADFDVEREISYLPEEHEVNVYSKSGIFFRSEKQTKPIGHNNFLCYIETFSDYDLRIS